MSEKALQDAQLDRVKDISLTIRQAIRNSLPGAPDQFLTLMVPGKVLNFKDFCKDFNEQGQRESTVPSHAVQFAEGMLCDDMPAFGPLQLGPTGRSVARSYGAALSKLCPAGSTTGISDGIPPEKLTESEKRYQHAMNWLTGRDPEDENRTRVDVYRQKQDSYTKAFERKTKAFQEKLDSIPKGLSQVDRRREFDSWVASNYKAYNNAIQAAYMDWVTMGKKEEVEFYFSIVDNDSAMARVEASKECMRLSVVPDSDGSSEYQTVKLTPDNWAWYAMKKAREGPKGETAESLTFRISRLEKINILLQSMKNNINLAPNVEETVPAGEQSTEKADGLAKAFLEKKKAYEDAVGKCSTTPKGEEADPNLRESLENAFKELCGSREALNKHFEEVDKKNVKELASKDRKAQKEFFDKEGANLQTQIETNNKEIERLTNKRAALETKEGKSTGTAVQDSLAGTAGIQPDAPAPPSPDEKDKDEGSWTSISIQVSSSYSQESNESSSTSGRAEASGWGGIFSFSASGTHQESHSSASKEMANASMRISFECMRVDITRPWLRAELFWDHDLRVADGDFISPGAKFAALIDPAHPGWKDVADRPLQLSRYDLFPMYPTAFLVAANVILEIDGETSSIQSHLNSSATSGNAGLNYGPFSIGGSAATSSSSSSSTCSSTAAGCRIEIHNPQVIGWISQIVPELPRPKLAIA